MRGSSCYSICPCNPWVVALLLCVVLAGMLPSAVFLSAREDIDTGWIPWVVGAGGFTLSGLWFGFRNHGRVEPLAAGLFAMVAVVVGITVWPPAALLGALGVVGASIWGALAFRGQR